MTDPIVMQVQYRSGMPGRRKGDGRLEFDATGVSYIGFADDARFTWPWSSTRVAFIDPGRKRVDGMTVVAFGVLGALFGRKRFTEIVVSTAEADIYFVAAADPARRSITAARLADAMGVPADRVRVA